MTPEPFQPALFEFSLDRDGCNIEAMFQRIARLPQPIFFDGGCATVGPNALNRYSFLAADPIDRYVVDQHGDFDFKRLRILGGRYPFTRLNELPPFQGGLAGLLSYGLNARLESIGGGAVDEFKVPLAAMNVYDVVLAVDKLQRKGWIISQGWPASEPSDRRRRAEARLDFFRDRFFSDSSELQSENEPQGAPHSELQWPTCQPQSPLRRLNHELELYSDFDEDEYRRMVDRAVRFIHAGDVFQVNLSQRLLTPASGPASALYRELRRTSPAPFSGYFDYGHGQIVSASPERLVSVVEGLIETRPIKGTRPRTHFPEVDLNIRGELAGSEKDRAENIMIVDLMRNDLSAVAVPDSVLVKKLCGIEQFQDVMHLVSVVEARLRKDADCLDLLRSIFPGGSITGAPKIRAMEIIAELEPTARGAYCGSLGYIGPDGTMDFNILIRTIIAAGGWWQIPVGGGIVSDSQAGNEYDETLAKSVGMLKAVSRTRAASIHASVPMPAHAVEP